jgi:hypothetical protein
VSDVLGVNAMMGGNPVGDATVDGQASAFPDTVVTPGGAPQHSPAWLSVASPGDIVRARQAGQLAVVLGSRLLTDGESFSDGTA